MQSSNQGHYMTTESDSKKTALASRTRCSTRLLSDEPTGSDDFQTHRAVAEAICEMIQVESGGRRVALTGAWGGGKSSVVKMLGNAIEEDGELFIFDAWSHRGDPLRRAFLEELINFLKRKEVITEEAAEERRREISGRKKEIVTDSSPMLTTAGCIVIPFVILGLPVAVELLKKALPLSPSWLYFNVAQLIVFFLLLLAVLGAAIFKRSYAQEMKSVLVNAVGSMVNLHRKIDESTQLEGPEPSSLEFQRHFQELMILNGNSAKKLVIVIDNLDRTDRDDALAIWSTLQTFFDFQVTEESNWKQKTWLVVPFDPTALGGLWSNNEGQPAPIGQAFRDKTFQVEFRVPPLVLSNWREYLMAQLRKAMPDHPEEDFDIVFRIHRSQNAKKGTVTPRDVKVFVNKLGSLHRQWQHQFPLGVQAAYAAILDSSWDIVKMASDTSAAVWLQLPAELRTLDTCKMLAAMKYGVDADKALQVLVGPKIGTGFDAGSFDGLIDDEVEAEWFAIELESHLHQLLEEGALSSRMKAAGAIANLQRLETRYRESMLRDIAYRFTTLESMNDLDPASRDGLAAILQARTEQTFHANVLVSVLNGAATIDAADGISRRTRALGWFLIVKGLIQIVLEYHPSISVPNLLADKEWFLLEIYTELANESNNWLPLFDPGQHLPQVVGELESIIENGLLDRKYAAALKTIVRYEKTWPTEPIATKLENRLNLQAELTAVEAEAAICSLLRLWRPTALSPIDDQATSILSGLVTRGVLACQLRLMEEPEGMSAAAESAVAHFIILQDSQEPELPSEDATSGWNAFNTFLFEPTGSSDFARAIAMVVADHDLIDKFIEIGGRVERFRPAIASILYELVRDEKTSPRLFRDNILPILDVFQQNYSDEKFATIVGSGGRTELRHITASEPFKGERARLYCEIDDPEDEQFTSFLTKGLRAMGEQDWLHALEHSEMTIDILLHRAETERPITVSFPLSDAIKGYAKKRLLGPKPPKQPPGLRSLLPTISEDHRMSLLSSMLDLIWESETPGPILDEFGAEIVSARVLEQEFSKHLRDNFEKLLERKDVKALKWLANALHHSADAFIELPDAHKRAFKQKIEALSSGELGEELAEVLRELKGAVEMAL